MTKTVILKFGGASVASIEQFPLIADIIVARKKEFSKVAVVVSAMGNTTDELIELAKKVNPHPPPREMDMLMTTGERISMALLAMALASKEEEAISFTGSQSGIITCSQHNEAEIVEVRPHRLLSHLNQGKIVIVAGFQGVSTSGEITTLGRGGSDTTAVALGVALQAERVEFYKNVPGVFDRDPKKCTTAKFLPTLSYDEALKIVEQGAKILHSRSLKLAKLNGLPLQVLSFNTFSNLSPIELQGTQVCDSAIKRHTTPIYERSASVEIDHVSKILHFYGLAKNQKIAELYKTLHSLTKRFPPDFEKAVSRELAALLIKSSDDFIEERSCQTLLRIILLQTLFHQKILDAMMEFSDKRHLYFKLFNLKSHLGLIVGVNFLDEKEVFEERHLLKAIRKYVPQIDAIDKSFLLNRKNGENICTIYLEVKKNDGSDFTQEEFLLLKRELPLDLKDRIEHPMHPIFMPRNEEEIMKNILSLASQIKTITALPQMILTFEEQTNTHLIFNVILVRVLKSDALHLKEAFQRVHSFLEIIPDTTKVVGMLRQKYPKEANVFKTRLPKEIFLRDDHSIDLFKARQTLAEELDRVLGGVRDYNGGMISKQNELLARFKNLLMDNEGLDHFLVENFFHSLTPPLMRNVLNPEELRVLYFMLLKALEMGIPKDQCLTVQFYRELERVYVMMSTRKEEIREELIKELAKLNMGPSELASVFVEVSDTPCLGFIFLSDDHYKQDYFCGIISSVVDVFCPKQSTLLN